MRFRPGGHSLRSAPPRRAMLSDNDFSGSLRNRRRHHLSATLLDRRAGNGWARLLRGGRDRSGGGFPNAGYGPLRHAAIVPFLDNRSERAKQTCQDIPKNRCWTTKAERMGGTLSELLF